MFRTLLNLNVELSIRIMNTKSTEKGKLSARVTHPWLLNQRNKLVKVTKSVYESRKWWLGGISGVVVLGGLAHYANCTLRKK